MLKSKNGLGLDLTAELLKGIDDGEAERWTNVFCFYNIYECIVE